MMEGGDPMAVVDIMLSVAALRLSSLFVKNN
jgi:hypothetical protein